MSTTIGGWMCAPMHAGSPGGPRTIGSVASDCLYGAKDNPSPHVPLSIIDGRVAS